MNTEEFFCEPEAEDNTWAGRDEGTYAWLLRSTVARARGCRRFLNQNLASLPPDLTASLLRRWRQGENWDRVFFEMIVARSLQLLGAKVEVEVPNKAGRHPDFRATFGGATVVVEATAPEFDQATRTEELDHTPLLELIDRAVPDGWSVWVVELPRIGPNDTKRHFKRALQQLAELPAASAESAERDFKVELDTGILHLKLFPDRIGDRAVAIGPSYTLMDNTVQRIQHAVKEKRRQVRSNEEPTLLAIQASGKASGLDDFDMALFGRTFAAYGRDSRTDFIPSGAFTTSKEGIPTYAGVLAYLTVGFRGGPDPILYLHPRFTGSLPAVLGSLEQRRYSPDAPYIHITPAQGSLLEQLGFVKE